MTPLWLFPVSYTHLDVYKRQGLLGAENIIGHLLVQKALNQGDTVYAYVRCPEKVKIRHIKLHLVQTKFSDNQDIKKVIVNADVMVSTLNPYTKIATKETKTPLSDTHKSIIQTMETWQKKDIHLSKADVLSAYYDNQNSGTFYIFKIY